MGFHFLGARSLPERVNGGIVSHRLLEGHAPISEASEGDFQRRPEVVIQGCPEQTRKADRGLV